MKKFDFELHVHY